jgi:formylglycine-generating enzyme required for sulfatase activity
MPKIFISYRREDSQWPADRLHQALKGVVGDPKRDIFIDVDNIPLGVNFVQHLDSQVAQCDVLLAIIGPGWLNARNPETGERRLDDPKDFVRIEIASALKRGVPVVPVVLDGAPVPAARDLPEELQELSERNGVEVRRLTFDADSERLIRGLGLVKEENKKRMAAKPVERKPTASSGGWIAPLVALSVLAVAGGGAWAWFANPGDWRGADGERSAAAQPLTVSTPAPAASTQVASPISSGETFRDCSDCPQMAVIPAGSFMMGSPPGEAGRNSNEGPGQRLVSVTAFAAGKYEVTWDEWNSCVSTGLCTAATDDGFGKGRRPVTHVSWDDATAYVKWLNGKVSGAPYRLLSEAEWEYAARAGTTTAYSWGRDSDGGCAYANGADMTAKREDSSWTTSTCDDGVGKRTSEVGSYRANAFGLHDMHGNVWEWVEDCYANSYSDGHPSDGSAFKSGSCSDHVNRGGSWNSNPQLVRSTYRNWDKHTLRDKFLGFRVAKTLY